MVTAAPRALIAGNWKMNGLLRPAAREIKALARALDRAGPARRAEILICPPATLIGPLADLLNQLGLRRRVALGGQDCHRATAGAHTGDISAPMLADLGCRYCIVGHSERRADHGEDNALVRAKAEAAQTAGLRAVICVGETEAERARGRTLAVLTAQLKGSIPDGARAANSVIAYEPVWAIGSGQTPTPADVARAHGHIAKRLALKFKDAGRWRLLYGGSVKPDNAAALLAVANVHGALVGGASLKADDFLAIIGAA